MFNVGDRVESISNISIGYCGNYVINEGDQGVVCTPPGWYGPSYVGVRWDKYIDGHNCDGYCTSGHGWAIKERYLELCYDTDKPFEFNEEDFENLILAKAASK